MTLTIEMHGIGECATFRLGKIAADGDVGICSRTGAINTLVSHPSRGGNQGSVAIITAALASASAADLYAAIKRGGIPHPYEGEAL